MKSILFEILKSHQENGKYVMPYYEEKIDLSIKDVDIDAVVENAIIFVDEIVKMNKKGDLYNDVIVKRNIGKEYDMEMKGKNVFKLIKTCFEESGLYENNVLNSVVTKMVDAIGFDKESGFELMLGNAKVSSAMDSIIEGYYYNQDVKDIVGNCMWMFVKSCLFLRMQEVMKQ